MLKGTEHWQKFIVFRTFLKRKYRTPFPGVMFIYIRNRNIEERLHFLRVIYSEKMQDTNDFHCCREIEKGRVPGVGRECLGQSHGDWDEGDGRNKLVPGK